MDAVSGGQGETAETGRMAALDVFRGITIAGMILVNNPGSWESIYSPLEHAAWHGWTPTDFVFPFFLFIVGVSVTLALARRAESSAGKRDLYVKILRRAVIIFALGLVLTGFSSSYDPHTIRIPGVLQRIAVCYLCASLIFLHTRWRTQALVAAALLLVYWALMSLVPVPGFGAGDLSKEGNLAAYLDRTLLGRHLWPQAKVYDPEGILSTLPAVATTLCGVLMGHLLRSRRTPVEKVSAMFVAGAAGVIVGWAWSFWFPINKALWSSSYVCFTAGLALQLLALCYWLVDLKGYRAWAKPFLIFGTNALAVYFLSELSSHLTSLGLFKAADGERIGLQTLLYDKLFASWATPLNASLLFAICTVLFWLGVMSILYRKKIFIKV